MPKPILRSSKEKLHRAAFTEFTRNGLSPEEADSAAQSFTYSAIELLENRLEGE